MHAFPLSALFSGSTRSRQKSGLGMPLGFNGQQALQPTILRLRMLGGRQSKGRSRTR